MVTKLITKFLDLVTHSLNLVTFLGPTPQVDGDQRETGERYEKGRGRGQAEGRGNFGAQEQGEGEHGLLYSLDRTPVNFGKIL